MIEPRPLQRGHVCWTAKKPWLHAHLPGALAGLAGDRRDGRAPRPCRVHSRAFDLTVWKSISVGVAEDGLLELELEFVAQVRAAEHLALRPPRRPPPKMSPNTSPKMSLNASAGRSPAAAARRIEPGMAEPVVGRALLRVGQDLVRLLGFLELLLGLLSSGLRSG